MEDLKKKLKQDARRHSNKLIEKIDSVIEIPEIVKDSIHQEVLYATLDGYRTTMKLTRNGEMKHEQETGGNR